MEIDSECKEKAIAGTDEESAWMLPAVITVPIRASSTDGL